MFREELCIWLRIGGCAVNIVSFAGTALPKTDYPVLVVACALSFLNVTIPQVTSYSASGLDHILNSHFHRMGGHKNAVSYTHLTLPTTAYV